MSAKLLISQSLFEKMSKYIPVKYYSDSEFAKAPYQATEDSAGYDLFEAETKTILPKQVGIISMGNIRWFLWKIVSTFRNFKGSLCYY